MQNAVKTRLSGGGASSLSTIRGIGAGLKPFRAAGNPFIKPGFTLAEVLITLGIIGVVASMTLPSIVNNNQNKQLEAGLKKSYSTISQALDMYQAANGDRAKKSDFTVTGKAFKDAIMPYFKVMKDCGRGSFYQNGICIEEGNNPYKTFDGKNSFGMFASYYEWGSFILADGSFIRIHQYWGQPLYILVDVNGFGKKPNRAGFDLFVFELNDQGKLLPSGGPGSTLEESGSLWDGHVSNTCSSRYNNNGANGYSCTYRALTDKDYWKNLPK